ncbi:hypothetical protein [Pseudoxanthomonas suwonensis]|uniref:hypothetical protein n=1 Tax=Pseudoxanthomonas suwonensis TaxID=314722 RepID=UPI0004B4E1BC|nr:hypothetical protein [Pseudoxanthomonas suwonensis]
MVTRMISAILAMAVLSAGALGPDYRTAVRLVLTDEHAPDGGFNEFDEVLPW